jgi:hypothetical protein
MTTRDAVALVWRSFLIETPVLAEMLIRSLLREEVTVYRRINGQPWIVHQG